MVSTQGGRGPSHKSGSGYEHPEEGMSAGWNPALAHSCTAQLPRKAFS